MIKPKGALYRYIYGSRDINEGYFYYICLVLRLIGLNIFHENWTPNLIAVYHCISNGFYWSIVITNFCRKMNSPAGFEFPDDMNYTYIWAGLTGGLIPTYVVLANRKALREVYDWVFVEFYGWFASDEEKLAKYNKKATRLLAWCKFSGFQVYSAALLAVFRPLTDGSGLPMYEESTRIDGIVVTTFWHNVMYASQTLSVLTLAGMLFSTDAMFLVTSTHLSAQLFMLGEELEEAGHSGDDARIEHTLNTFIDRHNAIHKCLLRLSYAYRPQSFILPFLTIVFSTFSLLAFDGSLISITSLCMAIAHMLHLLNFCLPAQTVLQESETLYQRVMHCNWHTWPLRQQRSLLLVMLRLKTPMGVHCGLSGVFSFEQFSSHVPLEISPRYVTSSSPFRFASKSLVFKKTLQTIYSLYNAARRLA